MFPGSLYMHDVAFVGGRLHANAVGHNAVVRIDDAGFRYAWCRGVSRRAQGS
jgi:hypothetical protein